MGLIAHGPAHDLTTSVLLIGLGIFFIIVALAPKVQVRGAFSYGKGPSVPINPAGRVLLLVIAVLLIIGGASGFFK